MEWHTGNADLMRRINDEIILNLIRERGPLSRVELTRISEISAPTVSRIVDHLEKEGFIKCHGKNRPNPDGGPQAMLWEFNGDIGLVLGISIDMYGVEVIVVDSHANVLGKVTKDIDIEEYRTMPEQKIIELISEALDRFNLVLERIVGIGIGIAGIVDSPKGIVLNSCLIGKNIPLKAAVEQRFNISTIVENDAKSMAFCELKQGVGRGKKNIFAIHLKEAHEAGICYGIIINGQLYHGTDGSAGEAMYLSIPNNNKKEAYWSTIVPYPSLVERAIIMLKERKDSILHNLTTDNVLADRITQGEVIKAAEEGDELALQVLEEAGADLGVGILNIAILLNPEMVIIDGSFKDAGELLLDPIRRTMRSQAITEESIRGVEVVFGEVKESVVAQGAACLVLEKIYKPPHIEFSTASRTRRKRGDSLNTKVLASEKSFGGF